MTDGYTMKPDDMILRRHAKCNGIYISTDMDSSAVVLNDVTFRRLILPRRQISAEHDKIYVSVSAGRDKIDSFLNVDCAAVELYDVTSRRLRLPRRDISAGRDGSFVPPEIDSGPSAG